MSSSYSDILKKIQKDWECENLMKGPETTHGAKIAFSSPRMNYATYGGVPRNAITEFYGEPGGGKSTTAIDICKNAQDLFQQEHDAQIASLRAFVSSGNKSVAGELDDLIARGPKRVLYIDLEHSFDQAWAKVLGIDKSSIDIMQPPDVFAEDILNVVLDIISTGEIGLIVLDSIPSLVPKAEVEKKLGERTVASLAGLMTTFCRKVVPLLSRYGTTMIFINQIRDNMDNPYVLKTPGGQAIRFYASLRIAFRIGNPVDFLGNELPKSTENPAGYIVTASVTKQKTAPHDRKAATYYLMAQSGIRPDYDYVNLAVKTYGIIRKAGAWFTLTDPTTGEVLEQDGKIVKLNGLSRVYEYMKEDPAYYEKLRTYIWDDINGKEDAEEEQFEGL